VGGDGLYKPKSILAQQYCSVTNVAASPKQTGRGSICVLVVVEAVKISSWRLVL
jgi:hypothetical protein